MPKALAPKPVQAFLLGSFALVGGAGPIHLHTRRLEALLAYLLLHPEPHTREKLATLIWGESSDVRARSSLRNALALLRKQFGAGLLLVDREQVQLNPRFPFRVDALAFREQAEHFLSALSPAPEQVDVALYRGELLQDFYDEWIAPERERYRALQLDTLLRLAQLMRARSAYPHAIAAAQRVLALDAANERAHQHLMFCYLASGQRIAALQQFEECRRLLRSELGVEPAAETLALHEWIKQNSGEAGSSSARITNLPIPLSSFIGREREMAQVKLLLQRGRLVTLSGAGGSGKTRLAVQVATDLVDAFEDGAWWVDLAPLRDETLVTHAAANALGVQERLGQPLGQTLLEALRSRRLLLLLDNCEHLIAACSQLAELLLGACSQLHILATSREPLNIGG
jgi:DNA-binding SARP family transcriptional activator